MLLEDAAVELAELATLDNEELTADARNEIEEERDEA